MHTNKAVVSCCYNTRGLDAARAKGTLRQNRTAKLPSPLVAFVALLASLRGRAERRIVQTTKHLVAATRKRAGLGHDVDA